MAEICQYFQRKGGPSSRCEECILRVSLSSHSWSGMLHDQGTSGELHQHRVLMSFSKGFHTEGTTGRQNDWSRTTSGPRGSLSGGLAVPGLVGHKLYKLAGRGETVS